MKERSDGVVGGMCNVFPDIETEVELIPESDCSPMMDMVYSVLCDKSMKV